jgi:GTP-binding protein EngB required for normal cell division
MLNLADQISQNVVALTQFSHHRDVLDIIDTLRSHGVSHYVDLPQIIVCGSQSSGKSSTLESLSGIAFPTSDGLCTRFATELILRRGDKPEIKVQIQPGPSRSKEDIQRLAAFSETGDQKDFHGIIEAAKAVMGLVGEGAKIFSTDILRIESTSPTAPNLTLVDLPGIFGASDKNQSDEDAELVQNLVLGYMAQQRSIILAVVTADVPFANQPVTKFARDIDPTGQRTLGLVTKPDRIKDSPESEKYYVEMAQNQNVKLVLGWHVLLNRSHLTRNDSDEMRDAKEAEFFNDSAWNVLCADQLGVEMLRTRLRKILWNHIQRGLPGVKADVQSGIRDCILKLQQLGKPRSTRKEKHTYLHRISNQISTLVRAAIDGVYSDQFFESVPGQQDQFERRLRAHAQFILSRFSKRMSTDGHALEIVEEGKEPTRSNALTYMMRDGYLEEVKALMAECWGRELPGTFNPLVVGDLFSRQCKPWKAITQALVEEIHTAAATTFDKMISEYCDDNTRMRLMKRQIQPPLHRLRKDVQDKVNELLRPHLSIHPITYNKDLVNGVQKIQSERHRTKFDRLSTQACGHTAESAAEKNATAVYLRNVLTALRNGTEPNVDKCSESLAADVAAAYYQVRR